MKCPYCEQQDPSVCVLRDGQLTISGEGQVSNLKQKTDVEVKCQHCGAQFLLEFQVAPSTFVLDLS